MVILPSAYLPPIGYFVAILAAKQRSAIDVGEHYIKRSIRNRATIATAQGVIDLTIPVRRANTPRSVMAKMEIDNSKRWQHQHWVTILSAYKSSPYFDHYAPYLEPIYRTEWSGLVEFNEALMGVVFKLLRLDVALRPTISHDYITPESGDEDLRAKGLIESMEGVEDYMQVFADRQPYIPNLSILDLLMCEGSAACDYLNRAANSYRSRAAIIVEPMSKIK